MSPDYGQSLEFLRLIYPDGPWMLTAISVDKKSIEARTFDQDEHDDVLAWLNLHAHKNLYYSVNEPVQAAREKKKLLKTDVRRAHFLHVDVDPRIKDKDDPRTDEEWLAAEQERILHQLSSYKPEPTVVVFSGGGYNALWRLDAPFAIAEGSASEEESLARAIDLERRNWQLELDFATPDHCRDVSRILRLPGTINRPNKEKIAKGRVPALSCLIHNTEQAYALSVFKATPKVASPGGVKAPQSVNFANLPRSQLDRLEVGEEVKRIIAAGFDENNPKRWNSRSDALYYVCCELVRCGLSDELILGIITDRRFGISASVLDKGSGMRRYAQRQVKRARNKVEAEASSPPLTDAGNAELFATAYQERLRWVPNWASWVEYDGTRWRKVPTEHVVTLAVPIARRFMEQAVKASDSQVRKEFSKHALKSESAEKLRAMVSLARGLLLEADSEFDNDPFLFNAQNGTINLRTGELRPHEPDDLLSKIAPVVYDLEATCTRWEAFVEWALPDTEVRTWVQRFLGYCLTGDVGEQIVTFFHGGGDNGKSTMLEVFMAVMGDYARAGAPDLLVAKQHGGDDHPTAIADLQGARSVVCQEVEAGRRWSEVTLKRLTGGDTITARWMRGDFFHFLPTHKLIVAANHKPVVRNQDHAIWRRIRLVPFLSQIEEEKKDKGLKETLLEEAPGILRWAVDGCLAWQQGGLGKPKAIDDATTKYRESQDVLGHFIGEECELNANFSEPRSAVYKRYAAWCERLGIKTWSSTAFYEAICEGQRGITGKKSGVEKLLGLRLLTLKEKEERASKAESEEAKAQRHLKPVPPGVVDGDAEGGTTKMPF